jgi:hypothetical protein
LTLAGRGVDNLYVDTAIYQMRIVPAVLVALILTSPAMAEGLQIIEPPPELEATLNWPQAAIDSGWQPPAGLVKTATFTSLDPPRITVECDSGFALAQTVPGSAYDVVTVEGLPPSQYKIETLYHGRVAPITGGWINVRDRGVQVRGAASAGTQHFRLVYSRPGGLSFELGAPVKTYETQDFYLTTACK